MLVHMWLPSCSFRVVDYFSLTDAQWRTRTQTQPPKEEGRISMPDFNTDSTPLINEWRIKAKHKTGFLKRNHACRHETPAGDCPPMMFESGRKKIKLVLEYLEHMVAGCPPSSASKEAANSFK